MNHFEEKPDLKQNRPIRRDLLLRCAGVSAENLEQCPENELNRYRLLGLAVLVPAMLGVFSGGYAIYLAFESLPMAIGLGLLWGWIVLTIDRVLIMSFQAGRDSSETLAQPGLWLRIGLALVIALTIAKPIELRLFQDSINQQIDLQTAERVAEDNQGKVNQIDSIRQSIISLDESYLTHVTAWDDQLARQKMRLERLQSGFIAEMDGSGGTLERGIGPVAAQKRGQMEHAEEELWYMEDKAEDEKDKLVEAMALGKSEKEAEVRVLQKEMLTYEAEQKDKAAYDLLAQLNGLAALSASNPAVKMASWLITLLFILIELVPLFAKAFMKRGPYHHFRSGQDAAFNLRAKLEYEEQQELMSRQVKRETIGTETGEITDLKQLLLESQLSHTTAYFEIERKLEALLKKRKAEIAGSPDQADYQASMTRLKKEFFDLAGWRPQASEMAATEKTNAASGMATDTEVNTAEEMADAEKKG